MKKITLAIVTTVFLVSLWSCENQEDGVYTKNKVWAHRVNSSEEANIKTKYFQGIEVDLVYDTVSGDLFVCHEVDKNKMNLTFREYLGNIETPNRCHYWLDIKNLGEDTEAICDTILVLAKYFGFESHFFVESWDVRALDIAKGKGIITSLWVDNIADLPQADTLRWVEKVQQSVDLCNPDALSAYYRMRCLLDRYFPDMNINLWQTPADFNSENAEITQEICRDPHVKVLLVDYDKPISY